MIGIGEEDNPLGGEETGQTDSEQTISLMGGVVRPEGLPEADLEFQSMKGPSKFLGQGTLLIIVVFVIAAGSLWAMRIGQGDLRSSKKAKEVEAKVEQALAKLSKPDAMSKDDPLKPGNLDALLSDTDKITSLFFVDPTSHQVPVDKVKKNPFVIKRAKKMDSKVDEAVPTRPREDPLKKLKAELNQYTVQSIIQGARPFAYINDEVIQPGHMLGSFMVSEIRDMIVVLKAEGHTFTLEMKENPNAPSGIRRSR